jgi:hypothetical protein
LSSTTPLWIPCTLLAMADTTIYEFACEDDGETWFDSEVLAVKWLRLVLRRSNPRPLLRPHHRTTVGDANKMATHSGSMDRECMLHNNDEVEENSGQSAILLAVCCIGWRLARRSPSLVHASWCRAWLLLDLIHM